MSQHIYAMHDWDAAWAALVRSAGKTAWSVTSHELGDNPADRSGYDFRELAAYNVTPLARLNFSHHGQGTLPLPSRYPQFAARVRNFVAASEGCAHWIIGNEPNWSIERPGGASGPVITPEQYADCFTFCRDAIKRVGAQHAVIVAAIAPYNVESGPWIDYYRRVLEALDDLGGADGIAWHFYSRGAHPSTIASDAKMGAPYDAYHNGFRAYRDFAAATPPSMRHLPVYGTETNQMEPWADVNSGWVRAAYAEIDAWNQQPNTQTIRCLCLYRWPRYDQWHIEGKSGVVEDFRLALEQTDYRAPAPPPAPQTTHIPTIHGGAAVPPALPPRAIADDFKRRVREIKFMEPVPGRSYYRLIRAEYVPDGARRFGPDHHILVDVLEETGKREMNTSVNFYWADGMHIDRVRKAQEPYGVDYAMTSAGHGFGVWVGDFRQNSDDVFGMGLGKIGSEHMGDHVSYYLVFQRVTVPQTQTQPSPELPQPTQTPAHVPALAHPIADPARRVISQRFGENPQAYRRFNLAGHTGIDFAVPVGTPIGAVDNGSVLESGVLPDYGEYVKLQHLWGESIYAHLQTRKVEAGEPVNRGSIIGRSGNTGNSTGPHLHLAIRIYPYKRGHPYDGFSDPLPYLDAAQPKPQPQPVMDKKEIVKAIGLAALEFDVDPDLLLSQAWAESSFDPKAISHAGAKGLFQVMDATWNEWAPKVGASNPFDAVDSARVGAAYMQWLLKQTQGNAWRALVAYGWGIGNVIMGEVPPATWTYYANKIIHGRDLLRAVG